MKRIRWLVALALLAPATLTAGPRIDFSGDWCSRCCDSFCPYDNVGFYSNCLPDFDGTLCVYNDRHYLHVGGC